MPIAKIKQILEGIAQQVHDHHIAIALLADVENIRDVDFLTDLLGFREVDDEFGLQQQL